MPTPKSIAKKIPKAKKQSRQPGIQSKMFPQPLINDHQYHGSNKLLNKVAIITGADSGIGQAVAICFAKEGAKIVIAYLNEHEDARNTKNMIEQYGVECLLAAGDVGDENFCKHLVKCTIKNFGKLDILVNNSGEQHRQDDITDITQKQMIHTYRTNIFSYFYMIKAALPHLKEGSAIINTASVTCYKGSPKLIDYSSTKGAVVALTRSLSQSLAEKNIRVNGVAPGPVWTPLIVSTFSKEDIHNFGKDVPMGRAGQPAEIAPCYVFLASKESSYMTGQILHPNGGTIVNG